jgi:2',3'-cyclic-nucleotide 2'-phosphodiesterase (5'-nucleotidase family)
VWDVVYKGNEAPPFQKLMGVQAMTVGNHEW